MTPVGITEVYNPRTKLGTSNRNCLSSDPTSAEEFGAVMTLPIRHQGLREKLSIEGSRFARRSFGWTGIAKWTLEVFDRFKGRYAAPNAKDWEAV